MIKISTEKKIEMSKFNPQFSVSKALEVYKSFLLWGATLYTRVYLLI